MRSALVFATTLGVLLGVTAVAGSADDQPPKKTSLMTQKLTAAQKILEGLALTDYTLIGQNAGTLNDISKQAAWKMVDTPRYEQYSEEFQRLTLKMANEAKKKNLDGTALSYVEMTLLCVRCHQHVREVKIGRAPPTDNLKKLLGE